MYTSYTHQDIHVAFFCPKDIFCCFRVSDLLPRIFAIGPLNKKNDDILSTSMHQTRQSIIVHISWQNGDHGPNSISHKQFYYHFLCSRMRCLKTIPPLERSKLKIADHSNKLAAAAGDRISTERRAINLIAVFAKVSFCVCVQDL